MSLNSILGAIGGGASIPSAVNLSPQLSDVVKQAAKQAAAGGKDLLGKTKPGMTGAAGAAAQAAAAGAAAAQAAAGLGGKGLLEAMMKQHGEPVEKAAYMSVLMGAMKKAQGNRNFNLETAILDLRMKLDNLRMSKKDLANLGKAVGASQMHTSELDQMLKGLGGAIQQVGSHIKLQR